MSELRQNLATKEWVIISAERAKKPNAVLHKIIGTPASDKAYDPECPFCPGNEDRFPLEERYRVDDGGGSWIVRTIDNKFKIVIRTAPYALSDVPYYHWHIQIMPRTKIVGGFERGTRIQVNTIVPEDSARMLRDCTTC